jgi:hypothetical protein
MREFRRGRRESLKKMREMEIDACVKMRGILGFSNL